MTAPKLFASVLVLLGLAAMPAAARAVADDCDDPLCKVSEVIISTGYDHGAGTTYTPVTPDGWWTLVGSPNAGLTVPSPAFVITPNIAWSSLANAGWISAYATSSLNLNNPSPQPAYSFERCICVCEATTLRIVLDFLVDNVGDVYFDGLLIGSQANPGTTSFTDPLSVDTEVAVAAGQHCLRVDVRNLSGGAMGFSLEGTISAVPAGSEVMLSPACCNDTGKIIVRKFSDTNCDGTKDGALQGWTFTLTPGGTTAVTDANGSAYFTVAPGTWTVTETPQLNWTAETPASGSLDVTVATGEVQVLEFLNCPDFGSLTICKYRDMDCDGLIDDPAVPMSNWPFTITPGGQTVFTGASGCKTLSLTPGTYTITEGAVQGWTCTSPPGGVANIVIVKDGSVTVDFLNCPTEGTLVVCKYLDKDCNGVKDVPNVSLPGWTFTLTPGGYTAVTNGSGCATFHVPGGFYTLTETVLGGWTPSDPPTASMTVLVTNGVQVGAEFLNCPPWIDNGGAIGWAGGFPHLDASGSLIGGTPGQLDLTAAPASSTAFLAISLGGFTPVPFHCGLLQAFPLALTVVTLTDGAGEVHLPFTWPFGVPPGLVVCLQYVMPEPTAACGFALSNAIEATTP